MASRLLDEMHQMMRRRHYSIRTEKSYCAWVKRYVHFHEMRSRAGFRNGEQKIEAFLNHLAIDVRVAPSTQNQAMNALVFLYKHVLKQPLDGEINAERAPRRMKLPVVLPRMLKANRRPTQTIADTYPADSRRILPAMPCGHKTQTALSFCTV
jgi:site-specific recombinase XerD